MLKSNYFFMSMQQVFSVGKVVKKDGKCLEDEVEE